MATTVVCKGSEMTDLLKKLLADPASSGAPVACSACYALRPAAVTSARRLLNTQGSQVRCYDNDDDTSGKSERETEDDDAGGHRRARDFAVPSFFSQDVLDRFGAPMTVGRLLALMEDTASGGLSSAAASAPGSWLSVAKEDDDAVYLKVPMPGLGKEHVKVHAEQNSLVIKGVGEKEPWDGDKDAAAAVPRYSCRIELAADAFKMDKIKAEMKNGMLRVTVPKVKKEERKDVFQVMIE